MAGRVALDKSEGVAKARRFPGRLRQKVGRFLFTLFSTPLFTPLGPEFSCCYRPAATFEYTHFSLTLTAALKWSTALRGLWRACPRERGLPDRLLAGLPARPLAGCNGGAYKTWSPSPASPEPTCHGGPVRHGCPARILLFEFLISVFPCLAPSTFRPSTLRLSRPLAL